MRGTAADSQGDILDGDTLAEWRGDDLPWNDLIQRLREPGGSDWKRAVLDDLIGTVFDDPEMKATILARLPELITQEVWGDPKPDHNPAAANVYLCPICNKAEDVLRSGATRAASLADRLRMARNRDFVGRSRELEMFKAALAGGELPFNVLYVFGSPGVGKTRLLGELSNICARSQVPAVSLDAHEISPAPESLVNALRDAMHVTASDSPLQILASCRHHHVILIDSYNHLAPLDDWLRDAFLPQLPENTLVVLAGREPPSSAWLEEWSPLIHTMPLSNFSLAESQAYLTQHHVPTDQHPAILRFTWGHPLALALVVEEFTQRPNTVFQPENTPNVVKRLLERFLHKVPDPAHRQALEACALVHQMTEELLAEMLGIPDVHDIFAWLRGLSFIEWGPGGLFPHDLAREVWTVDLRWRTPDWFSELHHRARAYYVRRVFETSAREQQRVLSDYMFLLRDDPAWRPFLKCEAGHRIQTDIMRADDTPKLRAMVAQHEGKDSALLAEYWFRRQPHGVQVWRDLEQEPAGFLAIIDLHQISPQDMQLDPAVQAVWCYLQSRAPLRPGETAALVRFWAVRDTYQAVSPIQSEIWVSLMHYVLTTELAFSFYTFAQPDFWRPLLDYLDVERLLDADFEVGGRQYGVYGRDWRKKPLAELLALLLGREVAVTPQAVTASSSEAAATLDETAFKAAALQALHDLRATNYDALLETPVLQSQLAMRRWHVRNGTPTADSIVYDLLKEATDSLRESPGEDRLAQALYYTHFYLDPNTHKVLTYEAAARKMHVAPITVRRDLEKARRRLAEILWQQESHLRRNGSQMIHK